MSEQPLVQLAPHSQEAEEALLGAILINPDAFEDVAAFLSADDFFILRNSWLWEAMDRLAGRKEAIDELSLSEELKTQGRLEDAGGMVHLVYLINNADHSLHAPVYGHIIERAATRRRLLEAAGQIATLAVAEDNAIDDTIEQSREALDAAVDRRSNGGRVVSLKDAVSAHYDHMEAMRESGETPGLKTGFVDLDKLLTGFHKSDLIIMAARPGMGKSSLANNIMANVGKGGNRAVVFSLEMNTEQLVTRWIAVEASIDTAKFRTGKLSAQEYKKYVAACGIGEWDITIDDTPAVSSGHVASVCGKLHRRKPLDLIVVDYLQLMQDATGKYSLKDTRTTEIGKITGKLKELARELNVPVLVLSQLSRNCEYRPDKRPMLSDLRESGSIEQDADVVMFIYRDEVYNKDTERPNLAEIIIAKHRNGPTGMKPLHWRKEYTQFANLKQTPVDLGGY